MAKLTRAESIVEWVLKCDYFLGENPAIPVLWVKGKCRLFLVLGENAGGKSFFRRLVQEVIRSKTSIKEVIHLSMQGRAGGYMGAMGAFIYGSEHWRSTGENSASTVSTAIKTCRGRESGHVLYWDEPDVGMSDGAAAGAGIAIAEFVADLPDQTKAVFVTTHSRALAQAFMGLKPHYIHLGVAPENAPQTFQAWLDRPVVPVSPEETQEASHVRFKAIQAILDQNKKR